MELTVKASGHVGGRARARGGRWRPAADAEPCGALSRRELQDVWDRHGGPAYALACALLGSEAAAAEVVRRAMADLARPVRGGSTEEPWRRLVRHVYRRAQEPVGEASGPVLLPPVMVWLSQLAWFQRAGLALCVYGRLTHREAAALLDVPPDTVAHLLTSGLRELRHFTADATATCA